ncbi:hypothetical protein ABPG75_006181 [Micractinium tetrahymenae]
MAPQPPAGFAGALIAALRDAEAAAAKPKPPAQLAEAAWSKLQFDFPVVSAEELSALAQEYATGVRSEVSVRFLSVVREGAAPVAPASGEPGTANDGLDAAEPASSASALAPLFQQLYAVAVLQSLRCCLEAPEAAAAAKLSAVAPEPGPWQAGGFEDSQQAVSRLEEALAAAGNTPQIELEHRLSLQEDDNNTAYEPLEQAPQQHSALLPAMQQQQQWQQQHSGTQPGAPVALPMQLAQLAEHLSYHLMSDAATWRELGLMQRVAGCLAAARGHPRWAEMQGAAQPLLRLATDRLTACPAELEAGLPALLDALAIPSSGSGSAGSSAGGSKQAGAVAAELALAAAVALAAQVNAPAVRRRLWGETHARLLPVAATQLEEQQVALARAARSAAPASAGAAPPAVQVSSEQLYRIMMPCQLLYFYVLEAPRVGTGPASSAQLQEALLKGGLLRALVLLFCQLGGQAGAEPLRCALLLACAAAQPLADWAAAVPGFAAAVGVLAPGGEAAVHGALWRLLLGDGGGELAALLGDATPADKVPGVLQALQLMADLQAVSRRPAPLWGADVEGALRTLADTLRQHYSRQRQEEQAAAAGEAGSSAAAVAAGGLEGWAAEAGEQQRHDEAEEARKLGRPAGEQAAVLAARRAARLQPTCLKLIKDLLQRRAGGGKHD